MSTLENGSVGGASCRRIVKWTSILSLATFSRFILPPSTSAGSKPYTSSGSSGPSLTKTRSKSGLPLSSFKLNRDGSLELKNALIDKSRSSFVFGFNPFGRTDILLRGQATVTLRPVFSPHAYRSPNADLAMTWNESSSSSLVPSNHSSIKSSYSSGSTVQKSPFAYPHQPSSFQ